MSGMFQPGGNARRSLLRGVLGIGLATLFGSGAATADEDAQVVIDNFSFTPKRLIIKAGATVKWLNHDDIPHSIVVQALRVKSPPMDSDEAFTYKFERPGSYDYICGLHPHMQGQVMVRA